MTGPTVRREERADRYIRYRVWCPVEKRERYVFEHQLVALLHGADPYKIFSGGRWHCHHQDGCRLHNTGDNLEIIREHDHGPGAFEYEGAEG